MTLKSLFRAASAACVFGSLSARATALSEVGDTFVKNGSFSSYAMSGHHSDWTAAGFRCDNWTFTGSAGLQDNAGNWKAPIPVPSAPVAYFESADATLTQDLTITTPGRYEVTFKCAPKTGYTSGTFETRILSDDTAQTDTITFTATDKNIWTSRTVTFDIPYADIGKAFKLQFAAAAAAVDEVQMTLKAITWPLASDRMMTCQNFVLHP